MSILQKKAIGELYRVIPFSNCVFNVCGSYTHPIEQKCKRIPLALHQFVRHMKTIQWPKLWYNFPVVIQSCSGEQAVSFKKVGLPESLYTDRTLVKVDTTFDEVRGTCDPLVPLRMYLCIYVS